jgi:hypothetical protein
MGTDNYSNDGDNRSDGAEGEALAMAIISGAKNLREVARAVGETYGLTEDDPRVVEAVKRAVAANGMLLISVGKQTAQAHVTPEVQGNLERLASTEIHRFLVQILNNGLV